MFDTLNFSNYISKDLAFHLLENTNLFPKKDNPLHNLETVYYNSNLKNYSVKLTHYLQSNTFFLKFEGSVAKFQRDENFTDLKKSDLLEFIQYLEEAIQINVNGFKINRVDLSFNIEGILSENVFEVLGTLKSAKKATNDSSITYTSNAFSLHIYNKMNEVRQKRKKTAKEKAFVEGADELTKYEHRLESKHVKKLFKRDLIVSDLLDDKVIQTLTNSVLNAYNAIEKISECTFNENLCEGKKDFELMLVLTKWTYSELEGKVNKCKRAKTFKRAADYTELKTKWRKAFKENKFEKVENETLKTLNEYFENLPQHLKMLGF